MMNLTLRGIPHKDYFQTLCRLTEKRYGILLESEERGTGQRVNCRPDSNLPPESFTLHEESNETILCHADDRAFLYGILECAELLAAGLPLTAKPAAAPLKFRAVKFDLPWSAYRPGRALSDHHETCLNREFWTDFLDMMVLNRFNVLSLWNLHPFPFLIRCTAYPESCPFDEKALESWRSFWCFLFYEARIRGIETYLVFWNIFTSYAFQEAHGLPRYEGQYHFGPGYQNELVADYNRECIRQLIDEYPDLTGLGISLGERMQGMSVSEQADWVEDVVFRGVKSAGRRIKFIYRAPFAQDPEPVRRSMEEADIFDEVFVEYKFNWSHGHSSTELCSTHDTRQDRAGAQQIKDFFWNPPPKNYSLCWTVRNEDFFVLRWGRAAFIREHILKNSPDWSAGYFIGSEGMVPARDIYRKKNDPERTWTWLFERQWLFWQLWGQLLYNPLRENSRLMEPMIHRYGSEIGPELWKAWQTASEMPLLLASFYGATWDYTLYAEGFLSPCGRNYSVTTTTNPAPENRALISLKDLMESSPMDPHYLSFKEWAEGVPENQIAKRISPHQLAVRLRENEAELRASLKVLKDKPENPGSDSPASEIRDIEAWTCLTAYFACKLEAGMALVRDERNKAGRVLEEGLMHWDKIITLMEGRINPVPFAQHFDDVFVTDWKAYRPEVLDDLQFADTCNPQHSPLLS